MIQEESKESLDPLMRSSRDDILFSTDPHDPQHLRLKGSPVTFVAMNIPSIMGGRANPWRQAAGKVSVQNPYSRSAPSKSSREMEKQLGFREQNASDGVLEILSFASTLEMGVFKRGSRVA